MGFTRFISYVSFYLLITSLILYSSSPSPKPQRFPSDSRNDPEPKGTTTSIWWRCHPLAAATAMTVHTVVIFATGAKGFVMSIYQNSMSHNIDSNLLRIKLKCGLVCELTLRVNRHSNGQESPLSHHFVF